MGDDIAGVIYAGVILIAVAGWFIASDRPSLGKTLQMALVWGMIFLGAVGIFGMWDQISNGLFEDRASFSDTEIRIPRGSGGHFFLTADINGTPIEFLVDTGATDLVLTKEDASRVGIDVDALAFLGRANTANGEVPIARTRIDRIEVGPYLDRRVLVSVNGGPMATSLLGMTYLSRYNSIEIAGSTLILRR